MNAVSAQGPVERSALAVSGRRAPRSGETVSFHVTPRRPIGSGSRDVILTRPTRSAPRRVPRAAPAPTPSAMKRPLLYLTSFLALVLTSIAAVSIGASMDSPRTLMSPVDYATGKHAIEALARTSLSRCRGLAPAEKDICRAQVRADERVQKADLTARYYGTVNAAADARSEHVRAAYDVARARCGSQPAENRVDCLHAAREERNRLIAQNAPAAT